jgi:hypothetical protein
MIKNKFCISCNKYNRCSTLTVGKCVGESCSFARSKEQAKSSIEKAYERLASLDKENQRYISDKYYGGKMPWVKGGEV